MEFIAHYTSTLNLYWHQPQIWILATIAYMGGRHLWTTGSYVRYSLMFAALTAYCFTNFISLW